MAFRMFIIGFAVCIDAFVFLVELFATALGTTVLGAAGGCALGAQYLGDLGCKVGAFLGGIVGIAAQSIGAGEVVGALLGYVIGVCITFSFGVMLVGFFIFTGCMSLKNWTYTGMVFLFKLFPILGLAPGWTAYAFAVSGIKEEAIAEVAGAVLGAKTLKTEPQAMQDIFRPTNA